MERMNRAFILKRESTGKMKENKNRASQRDSAEDPTMRYDDGSQPSANPAEDFNDQEDLNQEPALEEPNPAIIEQLEQELEAARNEAAKNLENWQRERADFMNYKRRIERDQVQATQNITGSIIKRFLPVLDDLQRALKNRPTSGEAASWAEGIELIVRKLQTILENEGVKPIPAEGAMFDPNTMEAISHEDSPDHESGQVIEVVQQGYTLGDRVLRQALVRVAR